MARYLRTGETIRLKDAQTINAGFDHACRLGLMPNFFISVHWHWTKFAYQEDQSRALWRFLQCLRKWFYRRKLPVVWMYIRERPNDASSEHFHLLLHCPDELEDELNKATPRWAEAHDDRAVRIRRCWERKVIRGQEYNARSLALGYMLKAGDVNVKKRFPRSNRWSDEQGTIVGKRVGVSAAIGPKALASFRKNPVFGVISGPQQPQEISNSIKGGIQISQQISIQKNAAA